MRAVLTAATVVTDDGVHYNTKDVCKMVNIIEISFLVVGQQHGH